MPIKQENNKEYSEGSVTNNTFHVREADGCGNYKKCSNIDLKEVEQ